MNKSQPLVLGVDLSTQSCTVEARTAEDFHLVATAAVRLSRAVPPVSEQNPCEWYAALTKCLNQLRERGVNTREVCAVSIAGQCHGLVPLDSTDAVIRPAKLWNDTTGAPAIRRLVDRLGREYWVDRVQSVPKAAFTIAKLAFLIENEASTLHSLESILLPHDYLTFRITGKKITDRSEASGTGYFDSVKNIYRFDVLRECFGDRLPWEQMFPRVLGPDACAGFVTSQASDDLGIPEGTPVAPGGGDQHLAAAGIGVADGDVCFSLGTSGVVFTSSSKPILDKSGLVDGVASATGGWLPLVCTLNCAQVTDKFAELMGVNVVELGKEALSASINTSRPVFAAYLGGERSPDLPAARGLLSGLTNDTTRSELALSVFEGVIFGLLRGVEMMRSQNIALDGRAVVIGGGARSEAYRQLLADHLGRPVHTVDAPEATARGAALQALAIRRGVSLADLRDNYLPDTTSETHPRMGAMSSLLQERYYEVCERSADLA